MSCCLPKLLKWKRPKSDSPEANKDHTQSLENHVGLPPKANDSYGTGIGTPPTTVPTTAERNQLAHRSNDTRESEVVNAHELDATAFQQNLSLPGTAVSSLPMTHEPDKAVHANVKLSRDLWEEAFMKLDKGKQDLFREIETPHGPHVVERVAKQTEEMYREHEERGWEANFKKGFESALKSIFKCKELISKCVALDPTGHAAAAWTIVSLGLQLAQNEMDRRQTILEASGLLAENLELLVAIEASYCDQAVRNSGNLEDIIVVVYVAILDLSAEIVQQNGLSTSERVLYSFTAMLENRLQELKDTLAEAQNKLSAWTSIIEQQYRTKEGKALDEKVDKILAIIMADLVTKMSILESRTLTAEEGRILDWYSKYQFFESHKDAISRRDADTGAWIVESSEYKNWKKSGNKVLWLYGNSGCGKSILCSTIVEDLREMCDTNSSRVLAYWYFTFGVQESLDIDNLRCSIIKQLCSGTHTLSDRVREHWEKHRSEGPRINSDHLLKILDSLVFGLQERGKEIFLVLDALDEYSLLKRGDFLLWIQQFSQNHRNVHVLITSRDEIDIRQCLGEDVTYDVANGVVGDVGKFIQSCLSRITQGNDAWKDKYRSRMSERMKGVGERRFRWVALVEQRFSICIDSKMMEDALRDLPETLEGLYEDLLKRIPKDYKEKARLILMWLAYSLRPLTLQELASAVSIPNPQKVLEVCNSSLVSLQRAGGRSHQFDDQHHSISDNIVKLDHFSVKEYLLSDHLLASEYTVYFHASPLMAHLTIAGTLVSHIIDTNRVGFPKIRRSGGKLVKDPIAEEDPLLHYSTIWYRHMNEADEFSTSLPESKILTSPASRARSAEAQLSLELVRTKCHRLFCGEFSRSFWNWCQLIQISTDRLLKEKIQPILALMTCDTSPILIASLFDMVDNVRRLLRSGVNVDGDVKSVLWRVTKPVQVAAIAGSLKVLRLLLEWSASFDQSDLDTVARDNSRHGADVLITILQSRQDLAITDNTVGAFVDNLCSQEMLDYFLSTKDLITLTPSMCMTLIACPRMTRRIDGLVEEIFSRLWFMIRHSKNILITGEVIRRLSAYNRDYSDLVLSLLMDHENCKTSLVEGLKDIQVVSAVKTHMPTCSVKILEERMRAAARWEPAAIEYLQNRARPNITFMENLADAEPSNSNT